MSTTSIRPTRKKRPNGWKALQPTCRSCELFREMKYKDNGDDAHCGRCFRDSTKLGRVKSSHAMACPEFKPRKGV